MRRKGVTSIELAKIAGVSSATISRAFSANSRISTQPARFLVLQGSRRKFGPQRIVQSRLRLLDIRGHERAPRDLRLPVRPGNETPHPGGHSEPVVAQRLAALTGTVGRRLA